MKENNKFVMGEDETAKLTTETISASPSTITATANVQHKRPVRHHVKRRSSGRVHVAKLAPMVRANSSNHTDTEADYYDEPNSITEHIRPTMKRSQSQRSLHKMSFDRKGFGNLTAVRRKSTASTASDKITVAEIIPTITAKVETTKTLTSNPASVSSSNIAEPVEITVNAVANNLVIPKKELLPTIASPLKSFTHHNNSSNSELADTQQQHSPTTLNSTKKQLLRSQFINASYEEPTATLTSYKRPTAASTTSFNHSRSNSSSNNTSNLSRTQQKLLLQKQQALAEDEDSPIHPRNMHKLNREFDMVGREYRCIKRYEDPMQVSLMRCIEKLESLPPPSASSPPQKPVNPQLARLQLGANQHSMSTSIVPTISNAVTAAAAASTNTNTNTNIPHLEQRQIAHRHHHLKSIALSRTTKNYKRQTSISPNALDSNSKQASNDSVGNMFTGFPWNAAAIIDRIFSNTPQQH
ncbi:unnamed protein product [Mucor circinelloides]